MKFLKKAKIYADMIKLAHTLFALPFALASVALSYIEGGKVSCWLFFWILIAFTAARSAAMGFNRAVDADIDALNPRTQNRPTITGKISIKDTKIFTGFSAIMFVAGCRYQLCAFCSDTHMQNAGHFLHIIF